MMNGRIYPKEAMINALREYQEKINKIEKNKLRLKKLKRILYG